MDYFISIVIGTLIGIFPNNFITEKLLRAGKSGEKYNIIITIFLDIVKGVIIVTVTKFLLEFDFLNILIALIAGTFIHSFFQEFKIKRRESITVALSGLTLIIPLLVIIWIIIWIISFAYKRNNNFSLPSATFLTGLLAVTSANIFNNEYWRTEPVANSDKEFIILIGLLFIIVVNSQMDRIKSYFSKGKIKDN